MEDQAYLEPDFEPSTLTIPRLRSILVAHNVNYPSSAKKQQLVDLFNDNVASQARKLRTANARVKRTSRGIEDISTGRRGTGAGDDEDEDEIPPTPATGRSSRRTTRARTEEAQEVEPTSRNIRHSTAPPDGFTPRIVSAKHARTTETIREEEPEPKRASRKPRSSAVTPASRAMGLDDEGNFSAENVFQSGSSPTLIPHDTDRRRTTTGITSTATRDLERRARDLRRRTAGISPAKQQIDGAVVPSRQTFDGTSAMVKRDEVEQSEEFTPEEQLDLVQAQIDGELVPTRRSAKRPATNAGIGIGAVLTVITAALGAVWRQEKLQVGYCDVGAPSAELAGVEIPPWAEAIRPQCEPCPPHAYCYEQLRTECESGFVFTQHPLSVNGLIPLPPTCEPDSVRARKVNAVKERAVDELRSQNAKYECGEAPTPELKETALKQAISTKRRKGMSNEEFEDLWASAIGEVANADEVVSGSDGTGHSTLRSTSLAALPLACAIRRSLRQTFRQYFWQLVAVLLVLSGGAGARYQITSGHATEAQAKRLAGLALEKLSTQASLHAQEPDLYRETYVSVAQLRDDVLRNEFSATRRKKLWGKVQKKVEGNANVRPMVREGRTGDVGRVWEWVGAVGYLESPPPSGHNRRKSGRVTFADDDKLVEPNRDGAEMGMVKSENVVASRRWDEGQGPYY